MFAKWLPTLFKNHQRESWERWINAWHIGFYGLLCFCTLLSWTQHERTPETRFWQALLCLLLGLWYSFSLLHLPRTFWEHRWLRSALYFGMGWALWLMLLRIDVIYGFLLFSFYPQICIELPLKQSIVFIMLLTSITAYVDLQDAPSLSTLIAAFSTGLLTVILKGFIESIIRQNIERRCLIEKLEATRTELAAAEHQAGVLEERQRLAREIHDTLAQGFISIVLHLEAAEGTLPPHLSTAQRHVDQARRTARDSLAEARRLVWALQPEHLERASLAQALTRITARWTEESGIPSQAAVTGQPRSLLPEVEVTLLRAAQEALANIRKHAQATHATLTLSYMEDVVMLDVLDDGVGFDAEQDAPPDDERTGGFGLRAMRARVTQLGGTLLIESTSGEGTTLAISMPAFTEQSALAAPKVA